MPIYLDLAQSFEPTHSPPPSVHMADTDNSRVLRVTGLAVIQRLAKERPAPRGFEVAHEAAQRLQSCIEANQGNEKRCQLEHGIAHIALAQSLCPEQAAAIESCLTSLGEKERSYPSIKARCADFVSAFHQCYHDTLLSGTSLPPTSSQQ